MGAGAGGGRGSEADLEPENISCITTNALPGSLCTTRHSTASPPRHPLRTPCAYSSSARCRCCSCSWWLSSSRSRPSSSAGRGGCLGGCVLEGRSSEPDPTTQAPPGQPPLLPWPPQDPKPQTLNPSAPLLPSPPQNPKPETLARPTGLAQACRRPLILPLPAAAAATAGAAAAAAPGWCQHGTATSATACARRPCSPQP